MIKSVEVGIAAEYSVELAEAMGRLRGQLSSRHDGSALDREQIEEIIESPWHAILIAVVDEKIVGMEAGTLFLVYWCRIPRRSAKTFVKSPTENFVDPDLQRPNRRNGQAMGSCVQ